MASTKEQIIEVLQSVIDPEVAMDIWTLGLIRDIQVKDEHTAHLVITYTSPMCPAGPAINDAIREGLLNIGIDSVTIEVTFDPPWQMPEALKTMLGL